MDFSPLFDGNGKYDSVRDRTYITPTSSPRQAESLTVRSSPKNAATAKMMYDMPYQALDKAIDGILGEEPTQPQKPKRIRNKKEKKPDPKVPNYKKKPGEYFLFLVNEHRYENFANDVQALNPEFVKRADMDTIWYKTLRIHHSEWNDRSLTHSAKKKVLSLANSQTGGYDGFNPKAYWELQKVMNGLEDMFVDEKEPAVQKNPHFKAMQEARLRRKAKLRLAVLSGEQMGDRKEARAKDVNSMEF
ncbi:hypothetical protein BKA64DRAFT_633773 [Cadophora sp. MPI-SDFR-AT-0126]|nr:hypothetical protein BKA64DRAFT_633773 [Leotiomycetes sp. MPI-SDFR-AT-0126]